MVYPKSGSHESEWWGSSGGRLVLGCRDLPERVVKYAKVLETGHQMVMLIVTLRELTGIWKEA